MRARDFDRWRVVHAVIGIDIMVDLFNCLGFCRVSIGGWSVLRDTLDVTEGRLYRR